MKFAASVTRSNRSWRESFPILPLLSNSSRNEPNSPLVRACVSASDTLLLAQITPLEFASAFYGMVRQSLLLPNEATSYLTAFRSDLPQYRIILADNSVFREAERLLDLYAISHNLRPADALQLASALIEHQFHTLDSFLTTDKVLITLAKVEGFNVLP